MSVEIVIATIGGIALLVGLFGGGIKAKEIEIPSINFQIRVISIITGIILLLVAALLSNSELFAPKLNISVDVQVTQDINLLPTHLSSSDYGDLVYEDNFSTDTGIWSLEKGSQIQNDMLILASNASTHPAWSTAYTDFVFETEFQFINPPLSGWTALSAYLKYQNPPCSGVTGNCSNQVAVSSEGIVAIWRPNGTNEYEQLIADTKVSEFELNGIHKLTVIVHDSEFRIFLNELFVRSFKDPTYKSGIVVLSADNTPVALNYVRIYSTP